MAKAKYKMTVVNHNNSGDAFLFITVTPTTAFGDYFCDCQQYAQVWCAHFLHTRISRERYVYACHPCRCALICV